MSIAADGEVGAWGTGTFYCQGPGGVEQCILMATHVQFAYKVHAPAEGGTLTTAVKGFSCDENCTTGMSQVSSAHFTDTTTTAFCTEAWAVDGANTQV